ncbi:metallophosphoesterase [Paenibacillus illinoisensis]|uniref:metallophosphoesterase n=1 Tax=Paenibacillus illinoisensis TaxID=59845 RepID=UPI00301A7B35
MNLNEKHACLQLKEKGFSRKEIAERLGLTERQVKRRLAANGDRGKNSVKDSGIISGTISANEIFGNSTSKSKLGIEEEYFGEQASGEFTFPFSKDKSLFRHEEGDLRREGISDLIARKYKGKKAKILYMADLHVPFTMYEAVTNIVNEHRDADIVVINGDLLDLFAVSKFAKDKEVAMRRELKEGRELVEFIAKRFKDVVITEGNHERRLKSFIKAVIPTDLQFLFPQDILQILVNGEVLGKEKLANVHVVGSWWVKLFDTIFAHPDNYTNANLKTVQNTSEYFSIIENVWHRACVIGHTHRAGSIISGEVLLMETGCLCYDMDYHHGSKFSRTKWTRAYSVLNYDEKSNIIFNDSKVVFL